MAFPWDKGQMERTPDPGAGTEDRGTVASRHSFIPLPVRKTKSQVRKAQEKRQEEKTSSSWIWEDARNMFLREIGQFLRRTEPTNNVYVKFL